MTSSAEPETKRDAERPPEAARPAGETETSAEIARDEPRAESGEPGDRSGKAADGGGEAADRAGEAARPGSEPETDDSSLEEPPRKAGRRKAGAGRGGKGSDKPAGRAGKAGDKDGDKDGDKAGERGGGRNRGGSGRRRRDGEAPRAGPGQAGKGRGTVLRRAMRLSRRAAPAGLILLALAAGLGAIGFGLLSTGEPQDSETIAANESAGPATANSGTVPGEEPSATDTDGTSLATRQGGVPGDSEGAGAASDGPGPAEAVALSLPASAAAISFQSDFGASTRFERYAMIDPKRLCGLIDGEEGASGWADSPFLQDTFECSGIETRGTPGKDEFRLFTIVRGADKTAADTVRVKISAETEIGAKKGAEIVAARIRTLFDAMGWAVPETIDRRIANLRPVDETLPGVRVIFQEERRSVNSYNMILRFDDAGRQLFGRADNAFSLEWLETP